MNNQIALILDGKITAEIQSLAKAMPVWIVQTQDNVEFINRLRQELGTNSSVTTFPSRGESQTDLVERIIYTLDEHHDEHSQDNPYDTLLVFGLALREAKQGAFRDLGFSEFAEADYGFIARKVK